MSKRKVSLEYAEFLRRVRRNNRVVSLCRWLLLIVILGLWELGAQLKWFDAFIFSSPSRMITTLINLHNEGTLWMHMGVTVWETIVGFVLGTVIGTLIAIILWWSENAARILDPYLVVLNALPKIALGPILIVWLGAGQGAIIMIALLISLVVTIMTVLNGFRSVDRDKILLMETFNASRLQILWHVIFPANIPTIISTLKINVGMSWTGVIVGEFLVSRAGLGYLIVYGGQVFKLDLVMASTLVLAVIAALMYFGVAWIEKRVESMNRT